MKGKDSKPHIGIFGKRNNGKSSLINVLCDQEIAIVSENAGTTTDPVKKSIEIPGIGPVVMIDTAGMDDSGDLGKKRINRSKEIIKTIDLAILVITENYFEETERSIVKNFIKWEVPFLILHNKSDLIALDSNFASKLKVQYQVPVFEFSTKKPDNKEELVKVITETIPETAYLFKSLIGDIINKDDIVLLITPIDAEAPEGRMILPQVQLLKDILDNDAIAVVTKETELNSILKRLQPRPALAVTDSQVFEMVNDAIPNDIPLTSFSIVLARYKGDFENYLKGTPHLSRLNDGDKILILESCTHHVSCDDIGREKIPKWLNKFSGKRLQYEVVAGLSSIPGKIEDYSIVIQCGGCMITRKQLINRLKPAVDAGIPVTNYGMSIAYMHGIYERAIAPFIKSNDPNLKLKND